MAISVFNCTSAAQVFEKLKAYFTSQPDLLPPPKNASITIKPNLNSNLDALTGNTTDLRVIAAVIKILKEYGYSDITIVEGPNGGFHRDGINVFARNSIDALANYYGCRYKDANYEEQTIPVKLANSQTALIAASFIDCDFFINIPKLKTHYETLVSIALKSLVGTLVGQPNKAKVHQNLFENILLLNDAIHPNLFIVDGLIAMEGTGPSAGKPVRTDWIMAGMNPYEIDVAAAKMMGFEPFQCPLIQRAISTGRISCDFVDKVVSSPLPSAAKSFDLPQPGMLAKLIAAPAINMFVRKIRNSAPVDAMLKLVTVRRLLLLLGLTQEIIIKADRSVKLVWNEKKCKSCRRCVRYCPQMLNLPNYLQETTDFCLNCLYCYAVCPTGAIEAHGTLGYYKEQLRRFGKTIKMIA